MRLGLVTKLLLVILLIVPSRAYIPCKSWLYVEIWENCGGCGFCLWYDKTKGGVKHGYLCVWDRQKYFYPDVECKVINKCDSSENKAECKASQCLPMFGSFKCDCDKSTYGRLCEFSKPQGVPDADYAVVADVILTPLVSIGEVGTLSVFFKNLGNDVFVRINTHLEQLVYNSKGCKEVVTAEYCKKWYASYPHMCQNNPNLRGNLQCVMTINFLFSVLFVADVLDYNYQYTPNQEKYTIGVLENITIAVYSYLKSASNNPVFEETYNMIIILQNRRLFPCTPGLALNNVGPTMQKRHLVTYAMREEIIITSSMKPSTRPECKQAGNYMYLWKLWKITENFNVVFDKPLWEVHKDTKIYLKPFVLEPGVYTVLLKVTCWTGHDLSYQYTYNYFEIKKLDLEAVITGGEERTIFYSTESLRLDGTQSWNPNVHPSKQQGSLKFYWSCNRTDLAICEEKRSDYEITYPGPFLMDEYYEFYLTVESVDDNRKQYTTSQIIFMSSTDKIPVDLICRKNCGLGTFQSNPGVVVYFEAVAVGKPLESYNRFNWTYSAGSGGNYVPVDKISQNNTPNHVLIVLANTLSAGENYTFRAKGVAESVGEAKFSVKMAKNLNNVVCELRKPFRNITIIRGVTQVEVSCHNPQYNKFAPTYDFYDVYPNESSTERGRLTASSRSIGLVVLCRGRLVVEITDEYGMTSLSEVNVNVKETNNTRELMFELLKNLRHQNDKFSDSKSKINKVSVIYDLMASENYNFTDISDITEDMLRICADIVIDDTPVLKVLSNLLNMIASEELKTHLTMKSVNCLSKSVTKLSGKLFSLIKTRVNLTDISEPTITEIYKLCRQLLKICDSIYVSSVLDLTRRVVNKDDKLDYYASYRESSGLVLRSIRYIMSCLSLITLPYEWSTLFVEDHIDIWLKEDTPERFIKSVYDPIPYVEASTLLTNYASNVSNFVIFHVAQFDNNPFSYNQQFKIGTNAIDLQILLKLEANVLQVVPIYKSFVINLQHTEIEKTVVIIGSVYQPDSNKSIHGADMQVAVHQLRVPRMGRLSVKFLNLEDKQIIRIRVLFNKRPDYEFMIDDDAVIITKSSPSLVEDLKSPLSHDKFDLYYIGILPGSNHPIGHNMNYSFEMSTIHCVSWKFHEWNTRDCKVEGIIESNQLQCECEVVSTFAGFSQVPFIKFDPFNQYKLLLSETNNRYVQLFLALLLLSFLLLLIFALWKGCNNVKGKVIYLEDNFPGDKFSYLVAVFTGSKFFGGTTSRVGIMIEGDKSCSRPHMLRSSWCRTLSKGEDDWFLLSTMSHLGDLKMVHLWMDYSGRRPEWYCYKIIIIDMLSHYQYLFFVDAWLSLRENSFIERFVNVTQNENDKRLYIAVDNLIFGLRDTHLWLGLWHGHSRSIVSRAQRIATAFNELLIIMLVSCLFLTVFEERNEDYPYYYLSSNVLFISVVSILVSTTFINILLSIFRKTFLFKVYDGKETPLKDGNNVINNRKHKNTNFLFRCCEDSLKVFVKKKKFRPVTLQFDTKGVPRKQIKYSLCCAKVGWMMSILMIITCFILVYYLTMSMTKVKALVWLTCIAIALLLILFLVAPLKIVGLSVISGLFYFNINQVVSYHIRMHLVAKYKKSLIDSKRHLVSKLISKRRHSCYLPLTYKRIIKKHHKQRKFDATLLLLDMFLIFVLLVLLFVQNETLWTTKYYWNNKQLSSLLRQGYKEEGVQLYSLTELSEYSLFIDKSVLPVVYQTRWYNNQPIIDGNSSLDTVRFVFGGTSKLFGLPRLRQIRLKPDLCKKPIYNNLSQYCNVKLTEDTEDMNLYAEGWVETGPREKFQKLSPWSYLNDTETYDMTLLGYSSIAYKGDGYVAELDMSEEKAEDIVLSLHREKWLDRRTCVVTFELTLYNAFTGTFSWLISVTENLHIGVLMNRVYVFTVSDSYDYPIVDFVFFLGLFMFIVRVFFVVNRNGIDDLADDFWNIFEMIMVCLGTICAFLFICNIHSKLEYLKSYMVGDTRDSYFEFLHLLQYLDLFRIILSILVIMLVCRFCKSWRFGNTFYILFQTMFYNWNVITVLFFLLLLASYLYWAFLSFMINDFMVSKHIFPVTYKIDFKRIAKSCNTVSCRISPFVLCFISLIVQLIIVSFLLASFRVVKRKTIEIEPINFFTVFFERFKKYLFEFKHRGRKKRLLKF